MAAVEIRDDDRVLHLVPPNGGGVDRFVRDLCRCRPGDWIVHVAESQCVVERPAQGGFVPLAAGDFTDLAFAGAFGVPTALHAHDTGAAVRRVCELLAAATRAPCVLTLHDDGFAGASLPPFEAAQRRRFVRAAAALTAPSDTVAALAAAVAGVACRRVDNASDAVDGAARPDATLARGVVATVARVDAAGAAGTTEAAEAAEATDSEVGAVAGTGVVVARADVAGPAVSDSRSVRAAAAPDDAPFAVAVIGAIGEHKGLDRLLEVAAALPPTLRLVLFGYTAQQLLPGWIVPGRLWLHGAFEPAQLPALAARFGARLAWFPPGVPESFSYALSDAWQAGLPALVPDHGALAERVRRHRGGGCYDPQSGVAALVGRLAQALADADPAPALQAAATLTTVYGMARAMTTIYRETAEAAGAPAPQPPDEALLRSLAQPQLDTRFFRKELIHLVGRVQALQAAQADADTRLHHLQQRLAERQRDLDALEARRRDWAADRDALARHRDALATENAALDSALQALRAAHDGQADEAAQLRQRVDGLEQRHRALTTRLAAPLRLLPAGLRERLLATGRRWLIGGG